MSPAMTYSAPPRWRSCDGVQCRYRWQVLRKALPDGKSMIREFKGGEIMWSNEQTHIGENVGDTPTHVIMIELK